ncbi:hypothetical protein U1Q18_024057 [Sarracenia purpurea var. burkii]
MKMITIIFMVAISMAVSISFIMKNIAREEEHPLPFKRRIDHNLEIKSSSLKEELPLQEKKLSRFLADQQKITNPRASSRRHHCRKDGEICDLKEGKNNSNSSATCCNRKCVELATDRHNCGSCRRKCEYTEACCRGECVRLAYDKRHCGSCNHRCTAGLFCIYGMCDYP